MRATLCCTGWAELPQMGDEPNTEPTQQDDTEGSLCELAGILTDEEADAMRTAMRDRRQRDAEAANRVVDLLDS